MFKRVISSSLFKRVITSVVGLPVLVVLLYFGKLPLKIALLALSVIAMFEFYKALSDRIKLIHYTGLAFAVIYYLLLGHISNQNAVTIILISFTLVVCVLTVIFHETTNVMDAAVTYFGFCYITILMSTIYLTRENNGWLAALAFLSAWGCDTGAYTFGRLFGKRKLTPKLSPKKTIGGAVGGILTAGALTAIFGAVYRDGIRDIAAYALAGMICAVFAQLGDLTASAVKRHTGIKDFGGLLPGHGGVIDRFDSVILTAPVLYLLTFTQWY